MSVEPPVGHKGQTVKYNEIRLIEPVHQSRQTSTLQCNVSMPESPEAVEAGVPQEKHPRKGTPTPDKAHQERHQERGTYPRKPPALSLHVGGVTKLATGAATDSNLMDGCSYVIHESLSEGMHEVRIALQRRPPL